MDDAHLVEEVARDFVYRHGRMAVSILLERAAADAETGDQPSAQAWLDLAEAAVRICSARTGSNVELNPRVIG